MLAISLTLYGPQVTRNPWDGARNMRQSCKVGKRAEDGARPPPVKAYPVCGHSLRRDRVVRPVTLGFR